mgnify:CR=1 FL=1
MAEPGSPEWWLRRLHGEMIERRPHLRRLHEYYDGRHPLGFASKKFLETFGGLFRAFADNWCGLVVDACEERLHVVGFRADPQELKADDDAWRIWQENQLDAQSQLAHTEALISGEAYACVWFADGGEATPEITVESPRNVAVAHHPKMRRRRLAALRTWLDEWGYEHAELFLPDRVHLFRSKTPVGDVVVMAQRAEWVPDINLAGVDEVGSMANPLGVVPVVALPNNPRLVSSFPLVSGSEIASVIPLQDGVNKLVADLLVASEAVAMPMRFAIGYELDVDPTTNQPVPPPFTRADARWAVLAQAGAQLGQLQGADLSSFVKAIEMLVQHVASISRTPPHYLNASADRLSGESIKAAETGLVAKVCRKQRHFGESWEEVMRLAGMVADIPQLAKATRAETVWADPESRTESEKVDSAQKRQALHVPDEQLWEDVGYSPQQISRFRAMNATQALLAGPAPAGGGASDVKAQADAMGVLVRSGVEPAAAAERVGLSGLPFTGAVPTTLRLPEADADLLEGKGGVGDPPGQ